MNRGLSFLLALTIGVVDGCGAPAPSSPAEVAIGAALASGPPELSSSAGATPRAPHDTFSDLFVPEMALDGFEPPFTPVFRQETWLGPGDFQQHCRELGYEKRLEPEVLRLVNAAMEAHGVEPILPKTIRKSPYVFAFDSTFAPALVDPKEPIVKLLVCTELKERRAERDRFFAGLRARGLVPDLPFGEPTGAWIRVFQKGEREWGIRYANKETQESLAAKLIPLGYKLTAGDKPMWLRSSPRARLAPRSELWWSSVK